MSRAYMIADPDYYSPIGSAPTPSDVVDHHANKFDIHPSNDYGAEFWARFETAARYQMPSHGWKLHVSATPHTWIETVDRVAPLLIDYNAAFKVIRASELLKYSLARWWDRFQVGKFYAIYVDDGDKISSLARDLERALHDLDGPAVLTDRPVGQSRTVYYRWGEYRRPAGVAPAGDRDHRTYRGRTAWVDERRLFSLPPWVEDISLGAFDEQPNADLARYDIVAAIRFSGRGGIFRATEIATGRKCIIKEGRALTDWDTAGHDARARLSHEANAYRALKGTGLCPDLIDFFDADRNRYLVVGESYGQDLHSWLGANNPLSSRTGNSKAYLAKLQHIERLLRNAVAELHDTGVAHGDLSPANIRIDLSTSSIQFIDLESWGNVDDPAAASLRTPGFAPEQLDDMTRGQVDRFALERLIDNLYSGKALLFERDAGALGRVNAFYSDLLTGTTDRRPEYADVLMRARRSQAEQPLEYHPPVEALATNDLGLGFGRSGLVLLSNFLGREVALPFELNQEAFAILPCGLVFGEAGLAVALAQAGEHAAAHAALERAIYKAAASGAGDDHETGWAGIGSAAVHVASITQNSSALKVALTAADELLGRAVETSKGVDWPTMQGALGFFRGPTGVADFMLSLGMLTMNDQYLQFAERALETDWDRVIPGEDGAVLVPRELGSSVTEPYLSTGGAGLAAVAMRLAPFGVRDWSARAASLVAGAAARATISPSYRRGAAGLIDVLLIASRQTNVPVDESALEKLVDGFLLTCSSADGAWMCLSEDMQRVSTDFLAGSAGTIAIRSKLLDGRCGSPWINSWNPNLRGGYFS